MMKKPAKYRGFVAAGLLTATLGAAALAAPPPAPVPVEPVPAVPTDPQQAIVVRQHTMKLDGKIYKALKAALAAGQNLRPYTEDARWFVDWGKEMPAMFPPGSETGHKTKAKPNIWTDKAGFDKFASDMVAASQRLVQAANANDRAGVRRRVPRPRPGLRRLSQGLRLPAALTPPRCTDPRRQNTLIVAETRTAAPIRISSASPEFAMRGGRVAAGSRFLPVIIGLSRLWRLTSQ